MADNDKEYIVSPVGGGVINHVETYRRDVSDNYREVPPYRTQLGIVCTAVPANGYVFDHWEIFFENIYWGPSGGYYNDQVESSETFRIERNPTEVYTSESDPEYLGGDVIDWRTARTVRITDPGATRAKTYRIFRYTRRVTAVFRAVVPPHGRGIIYSPNVNPGKIIYDLTTGRPMVYT